jgi:hypothetical protein
MLEDWSTGISLEEPGALIGDELLDEVIFKEVIFIE